MTGGSRALGPAWLALLRRVGGRGDLAEAGARLLAAYAEPHRAYHDLTHLDEVIRHVRELTAFAADADAVALAAWFHDVVYDPRRTDNEERSAEYADRVLTKLGVSAAVVVETTRLVRLTAGHQVARGDRNGNVLADADLAVLASSRQRYAAYTAGVRREYDHVGEEAFRAARAALLHGLLRRPALYRTPYGLTHWETPARRNVEQELRLLTEG